jgi:hypothetical protein
MEITQDIYFKMIDSAIKYHSHYWDCIELPNGNAVTFAMKDMIPYDICAYDIDDNELQHNFSIETYKFYLEDCGLAQ